MNKYLIIISLFAFGCASAPKFTERFKPDQYPTCIKAEEFLKKLKGDTGKNNISNSELFGHNAFGVHLGDEYRFTNAYSKLCKGDSKLIYAVDPTEFDKWRKPEGNGPSGRDLLIYSTPPENNAGVSADDNFLAYSLVELDTDLMLPINELERMLKEDDLHFDKPYHFSISFAYPDLTGELKKDAQIKRAILLTKSIKAAMVSVVELAKKTVFLTYLQSNMPMPLNKDSQQLKQLQNNIDEIKGMMPAYAEEGSAAAESERIDYQKEPAKTFWQLEKVVFSHTENLYRCDEEKETCDDRIRGFVKHDERKNFLTGVLLAGVTKLDIKRSEDKKTITINVDVDVPRMFKDFQFKKISEFLE